MIEVIRNYIEQDNPARAIFLVDELRDIMKRLAEMLRGFLLIPCYQRRRIRHQVYR